LVEYSARASFVVVGVWKETVSGSKNHHSERDKVMALAQSRKIDAILIILYTVWRFTFKIALEVTDKVFLPRQKSRNQPFLVYRDDSVGTQHY